MPHLDDSRRRRIAIPLLIAGCGLLLAGCVTEPETDDRSPLASARRVLALDFSSKAARRREQHLVRWRHGLGAELRRSQSLTALPGGLAHELRRSGGFAGTLKGIAAKDLQRRPPDLGILLPGMREFGRDVAEGLGRAALLLGGSRHPMGEIDDREHRTDPRDDHPEATLWQRLRRRLRL